MPTNPPHLRPTELSTGKALKAYADYKASRSAPVFCFQIGANDGRINDPVYPYLDGYGWQGLLVEPLTDVFENQLTKTYAGKQNVMLANIAIAPEEGELPLYRIGFTDARWATGLTSFRRENLTEHIANGYVQAQAAQAGTPLPEDQDSWIIAQPVRTTTVERLLSEHEIGAFDILCIDTEGFDFEILKLINIGKYKPEFVLYESKNLSDTDYQASKSLFGNDYTLFWFKGDTFAVRKGSDAERAIRPLRSPFRRIRRRLSRLFR